MAKGNSLNRKKMIKRNLDPSERNKKTTKIWINTIDLHSLLEFSKLCWMVKAKIVTLANVVLNVCRGSIDI